MTKSDAEFDEFGKLTLNPLREVPRMGENVAGQEKAHFLETVEKLSQRPTMRRTTPTREQGVGIMSFLRQVVATPLSKIVAAILILMVLLAGSSFTVLAAQNSLPGDLLYAVKSWGEDIRLSLTGSKQEKLDLILNYTNRRAGEISQLTAKGGSLPEQVSARYQGELDSALQLAVEMDDTQMQKALGQIKKQAEIQGMTLEELLSMLPSQAEPAIIHLQERLREQINLTTFGEKNPQAFRDEVRQRQHGHPGAGKKTPEAEAGTPLATEDTQNHQPGEKPGNNDNGKQQSTQAPGHNKP